MGRYLVQKYTFIRICLSVFLQYYLIGTSKVSCSPKPFDRIRLKNDSKSSFLLEADSLTYLEGTYLPI